MPETRKILGGCDPDGSFPLPRFACRTISSENDSGSQPSGGRTRPGLEPVMKKGIPTSRRPGPLRAAGPPPPSESTYPADPEVLAAIRRFVTLELFGSPAPRIERFAESVKVQVEPPPAKPDAFVEACHRSILGRFGLRPSGEPGGSLLPAEMETPGRWLPMDSAAGTAAIAPSFADLREPGIARAARGESVRHALAFVREDLAGIVERILSKEASAWISPSPLSSADFQRMGALLALEGWRGVDAGEASSPWRPLSAWSGFLAALPEGGAPADRIREHFEAKKSNREGVVLLWPGEGREDTASISLVSSLFEDGFPIRLLFARPPDDRLPLAVSLPPFSVGPERLGELVAAAGAPPDRFDLFRRALEMADGKFSELMGILSDLVESADGLLWWSGRKSAAAIRPFRPRWSFPGDPSLAALAEAASLSGGAPLIALEKIGPSLPDGFAILGGRVRWLGEPGGESGGEQGLALHAWLSEHADDPFDRTRHALAAGDPSRALDELRHLGPAVTGGLRDAEELARRIAAHPKLPEFMRPEAWERAGRFARTLSDSAGAVGAFRAARDGAVMPSERRRLSIELARALHSAAEVRAGLRELPEETDPSPDGSIVRIELLRSAGGWEPARSLTIAALDRADQDAWPADVRLCLEGHAADLAAEASDFEMADRHLARGRALLEAVSDPAARAEFLRRSGYVLYERGDAAGAAEAWSSVLEIARTFALPGLEADVQTDLGVLCRKRGDNAGARRAWERSASIDRELGRRKTLLSRLNNLAVLAIDMGDFAGAQRILDESIPELTRRGVGQSLLYDLATDAHLAMLLGDLPRATARLKALFTPEGMSHPTHGAALLLSAELSLLQGDREDATARLKEFAASAADLRGDEPRQLLLVRLVGRPADGAEGSAIPAPLARELQIAGAILSGGADAEARGAHNRETPHRLPLLARLLVGALGEERVAECDPALVRIALDAAVRSNAEGHVRFLRTVVSKFGGQVFSRSAVAALLSRPSLLFEAEGAQMRRNAGLGSGAIRFRSPAGPTVTCGRAVDGMGWSPLRESGESKWGVDVEPACSRELDGESRDLLLALADRAIAEGALPAPAAEIDDPEELTRFAECHGIITTGAPMADALRKLRKLAESDVSVFLNGESGTGKELFARALHEAGRRRRFPFVPFNVASIPENLAESELFGVARGAFTGADRDRPGLFEAARGGTLFLDEIAEMAVPLQAKLLRALQEGEVRRVGETASRNVDVRVVSASHVPLRAAVEAGRFREDLFYRVCVVELKIPPLRERGEDLPAIVDRLFEKVAAAASRPGLSLAQDARKILLAYSWPGNVRELENALRGAVAMVEGKSVHASDLPRALHERAPARKGTAPPGESYHERLDDHRKGQIEKALRASAGNVAGAARALGLSRQAVHYDMKRLGIEAAGFRAKR